MKRAALTVFFLAIVVHMLLAQGSATGRQFDVTATKQLQARLRTSRDNPHSVKMEILSVGNHLATCTITRGDELLVSKERVVLFKGKNMFPVNISALSPGLYTVEVRWPGNSKQIKFLKQ